MATSRSIIYLDMRPISRESMSKWLASKLQEFRIVAADDPDAVLKLRQELGDIALILVNLGPDPLQKSYISDRLVRLTQQLPGVALAVITDLDDHATVTAAFDLGLRGFIPTTMSGGIMVEVVRLVCAGGTYAPANTIVAGLLAPLSKPAAERDELEAPTGQAGAGGFTPRQMEILNCLRRGLANKLIAHELSMQESTVKVHVRNIMKKLRATNRTQVVSMTWGLFDSVGR